MHVLQELAPQNLFKHFSIFPLVASTNYSSIFHNPHNTRYPKQEVPFKLHLQFYLKRFFTKLGPSISSTLYILLNLWMFRYGSAQLESTRLHRCENLKTRSCKKGYVVQGRVHVLYPRKWKSRSIYLILVSYSLHDEPILQKIE